MYRDSRRSSSPTLRVTAWVLVALLSAITVGSSLASIEIVARGRGTVIPIGRTQTIQPQFPGQISEILVTEGETVVAGQVLMRLDPTKVRSEIDRLDAELRRQRRERRVAAAVVEALQAFDPSSAAFRERGESSYLSSLDTASDAAADSGLPLVRSMLASIQSQILEVDTEIARIERSISTQDARIEKAKSDLKLIAERNASVDQLLNSGTISRSEYLERTHDMRTVQHDLEVTERQREELNAEHEQAESRRERIIAQSFNQYRKSLSDAEVNTASLEANRAAAANQLKNTEITASIDGRIENIRVFTVGGFVDEGQALTSIVPTANGVEIEAFFENRDAGFLAAGQKAFTKLDAFPAERFGVISGAVTHVGSDARELDDQDGTWVYAARIRPDRSYVERDGRRFPFVAGMTGTIDVVTGERRLISYFFEPIVNAIQDGLRER